MPVEPWFIQATGALVFVKSTVDVLRTLQLSPTTMLSGTKDRGIC